MRERASIADDFSESELDAIEPSCDDACTCEECQAAHAFVAFRPADVMENMKRQASAIDGFWVSILDGEPRGHECDVPVLEVLIPDVPAISNATSATTATYAGTYKLTAAAILNMFAIGITGTRRERGCISNLFSDAEWAALPTLQPASSFVSTGKKAYQDFLVNPFYWMAMLAIPPSLPSSAA